MPSVLGRAISMGNKIPSGLSRWMVLAEDPKRADSDETVSPGLGVSSGPSKMSCWSLRPNGALGYTIELVRLVNGRGSSLTISKGCCTAMQTANRSQDSSASARLGTRTYLRCTLAPHI